MRKGWRKAELILLAVFPMGLSPSCLAEETTPGDINYDSRYGVQDINEPKAHEKFARANKEIMMNTMFSFVGGSRGQWRVSKISTVKGAPLADVPFLRLVDGDVRTKENGEHWIVRGFTSNVRYATASEVKALKDSQPELSRKEASCAAVILIRKSEKWWQLAQDERRRIFEEQSHHNSIGMEYLPEVARRLHHSRDLGEEFDFITWFEFAPENRSKFDELVERLRESEEWTYVEREVDIRLERIES
jgi:hypothetical protein